MVSLWDMLTFMSGCTAWGAAMAAAKSTGTGNARLMVGASVGMALAIGCIFAVRAAGQRIFRSIRLEEQTARSEFRLRLVYAAAALWIVLSAILSVPITRLVVRLTVG